MSGHGGQEPVAGLFLSLPLRHSLLLILWYVAIYLSSLLAVLLIDVPLWAQLVVALIAGVATLEAIRRHGLRTASRAILRLDWHPDARWHLFDGRGTTIRPNRWRATLVHPWLVVLQFWCGDTGRAIPVLVPADALDRDNHRRLRVRLRDDQARR